MRMYFIILHYLNIDDTINCVNSILSLSGEKKIIIVDNGSKNGTGEKLEDLFSQKNNISVIISRNNLGFAKGNNLGIGTIKDKSDCLVSICNSDLIFNDKEFITKAIKCYTNTQFAVLGPLITSDDGIKKEAPSKLEFINDLQLNVEIRKFIILNFINKLHLIPLSRAIHKIYSKQRIYYPYNKDIDSFKKPIKVHGSCFILSPIFFNRLNGLFPGSFLFEEENILANLCLNNGLKIVYSPSLKVIHLGSKSYKVKYQNKNKRFKNYIENSLGSLLSYKKYRESKKNENI